MSSEIYLVQTNVKPSFFGNAVFNNGQRDFIQFLDRVAEHVPHLNLPILAITDNGYLTPWATQDLLNIDRLPETADGLHELITNCLEGKGAGHLPEGDQYRVTAVVDFTSSCHHCHVSTNPHLQAAYDRLEQNYTVNKINIEDKT
jgi:hypothetical protein